MLCYDDDDDAYFSCPIYTSQRLEFSTLDRQPSVHLSRVDHTHTHTTVSEPLSASAYARRPSGFQDDLQPLGICAGPCVFALDQVDGKHSKHDKEYLINSLRTANSHQRMHIAPVVLFTAYTGCPTQYRPTYDKSASCFSVL